MIQKELSTLKIGTMVNVQAYKYDGSLYRQWNGAKVLNNNSKHIVLVLVKCRVAEPNNKFWAYKDPVLWFFPKNNLFNATVLLRKNGPYVYINMASHPIIEDEVLKYVDFDLDIKHYPNKELKLVDREEYYRNKKKLKYSKVLQEMIYSELNELINMYNNYNYIFDDKIINYYRNLAITDKSIRSNLLNTSQPSQNTDYKQNSRSAFSVKGQRQNLEVTKSNFTIENND
ncbi:DUF402 domain-containing protein [Mycoplasmopsis alligatoris]|uniref:DUF402 domain-containing protein n=1 Tax=Mycoplasmopsis alligatoris A21JP2 TaxID=747682 RepID=D4XVN6_9BACT|nr:DUF402 domain-containing protein [Mycoplasmopsis alligatoris]EFF41593.1 conserved hypothetical protein [Mycoplasmopsis alligatoris A21JP2]